MECEHPHNFVHRAAACCFSATVITGAFALSPLLLRIIRTRNPCFSLTMIIITVPLARIEGETTARAEHKRMHACMRVVDKSAFACLHTDF